MRVWLKWLLGGVACLAIAVGGVAIVFDWNWLRGTIAEQASKRTGRAFEIGTLQGQWSLVPTITVKGPFAGPSVSINKAALAARGAAAVALERC